MAIPFKSRQDGARQDRSSVGSSGNGIHALTSEPDSSRRRFLQTAATGAVSGSVALASMDFTPRQALAQSKLSPDAALQELMDGNQRFTSGCLTSFEQDLAILKQNTVGKREPFAAVLSCADSRVPVELIFDQSIGHVFVNRVAGNIVTSEIIASLEYGAAVLAKFLMIPGSQRTMKWGSIW